MAGVLALVVGWTRYRDASQVFYTVDSVLFGLGTEHYDLMALQPHPPGYPVFVALGWLARHVTDDTNAAFVLVAAVFSVATIVLTYGFALEFTSRRAAAAAAVLLSFTPSMYFNGVVALSYTGEAAASVGLAWLAWRHRQAPSRRSAIGLAAAASIGVGIRQSLAIFLGPLAAYALLWPKGGRDWRHVGAAGVAGLATTLLWFLPMTAKTGGVFAWKRATDLQAGHVVFADAIWVRGFVALDEHWDRLLYYLGAERTVILPGIAAFLVLAGLAAIVRRRRPVLRLGRVEQERAWFFLIWLGPGLAFYLAVFDGWDKGPIGYVLTLLPGFYVLAAMLVETCLRVVESAARPGIMRNGVGLAGAFVLLLPTPALADQTDAYLDQEVRAHDEWARGWASIKEQFPSNETAILTWHSWAHVKWYFPEYVSWVYFPSYKVTGETDWILYWQMQGHVDEARFIDKYLLGPGQPEHVVPPNIQQVVVFDFQLAGENGAVRRLAPDVNVTEAHAGAWRLLVFSPQQGRSTIESYFSPDPP